MPIPQLKRSQGWRTAPNRHHDRRYSQGVYYGDKRPGRKKKRGLGAVFLRLIFILMVAGGISFALLFAWFSRGLPSPDRLIEREVTESTKIYDRSGETILYDVHGDIQRTKIALSDIPSYAVWTAVVTEDRDFFKHKGFDLKGIIRSLIKNLVSGAKVGGSTITQQLVKNAVLTREKTYSRKIRELILSYRIEKKYTKEQILEMYFNEIPYGSTAYGIEAASQIYFGKNARDITLGEAAILAALPQRPTYYSPYGSHKDELLDRQKYIISQMLDLGYITEEKAEEAKQEEIAFKARQENIIAPHFVMYVRELLTERYGERMIQEDGLIIQTTLDLDLQKKAEEAVKNHAIDNEKNNGAKNAALVAIDPATGEILAMVGSRDYWEIENDGNVNVVLRPRQPGSSLKPLVYAAALAKGFTPDTILFDVLTTFKHYPEDYTPHNYSGKNYGPVTIKKALAGSLNIPAVKAIYLVGVDNMINLLSDFGYTTFQDRSRIGFSMVLGGNEVKLLDHVAAYAVFPQEGIKHEVSPILKIENSEGRLIEQFKAQQKKVLDAEVARQINSILSDNEARSYIFGTQNKLILADRPVCAKTGSTNDFKDAWTIGYTPQLTAGVWVGNNDSTPMKGKADGSYVAAPIWNEFMAKAHEGKPVQQFTPPQKIETEKPILNGVITPEITLKINKENGKIATEFTPPSLITAKTYRTVHNILHYVNKDDPQGPAPENPGLDEQYANWETAVQKWAAENGYTNEDMPTEYDDEFTAEERPVITIINPAENDTIKDPILKVEVSVKSTYAPDRVEYRLDGKLLKTASLPPYTLEYYLDDTENGFHVLKASVYDQYENYNEDEIRINVLLPEQPPSLEWIAPRQNASYYASSFPLYFTANVKRYKNVQQMDFYYRDEAGVENLITTLTALNNKEISFSWNTAPALGAYTVFAKIIDKNSQTTESASLMLNIK